MKRLLIVIVAIFICCTPVLAVTPSTPNPMFFMGGTYKPYSDYFYFGAQGDYSNSMYIPENRVDRNEIDALLMINGSVVKGYYPVIDNGRSLVPIRVISEKLGFNVEWDSGAQSSVISSGGTNIVLEIGSNQAVVNGSSFALDVPAQLLNGSTYVPLRFIADAMNLQIGYDTQKTILPIVWICEKYGESLVKIAENEVLDYVKSAFLTDAAKLDIFEIKSNENFMADYVFKSDGDIYGRYWLVSAEHTSEWGYTREVYYLVDKYTKDTFSAWMAGIFPGISATWFYAG